MHDAAWTQRNKSRYVDGCSACQQQTICRSRQLTWVFWWNNSPSWWKSDLMFKKITKLESRCDPWAGNQVVRLAILIVRCSFHLQACNEGWLAERKWAVRAGLATGFQHLICDPYNCLKSGWSQNLQNLLFGRIYVAPWHIPNKEYMVNPMRWVCHIFIQQERSAFS